MTSLPRISILLPILVVGAMAWNLALAQCEVTRMVAGAGGTGGRLGLDLEIQGDLAVVGAPLESEGALRSGSVHLFIYSPEDLEWDDDSELQPDDPQDDQRFGMAVAIEDDVIVVTAPLDDEKVGAPGAVYFFRDGDDGWEQEGKLLAGDGELEDVYGISAAIHEGRVVVGESGEEGSLYVYEFDDDEEEWSELFVLEPDDPQEDELFGESVAVFGDVIAAGAPDLDATQPGAVYMFRLDDDEWEEEQRLSGEAEADKFGVAVSMGDGILAVGAKWAGEDMLDTVGAVHVFEYDEDEDEGERWVETAVLLPSDPQLFEGQQFGSSVSLVDDYLFVGAPNYEFENEERAGTVYIFEREDGNWSETTNVVADVAGEDDLYGSSVAYDDGVLIVGAPFLVVAPTQFGAAYAVAIEGDDCDEDDEIDFCQILAEDEEDCNGNGLIDDCELEEEDSDRNENEVIDECDPALWYRLQDVASVYASGNGLGEVCTELSVEPNGESTDLKFPVEIDAFEGTVFHDDDILRPIAIRTTGEIALLNDGDGPDFLIVDLEPGGDAHSTFSVIFSALGEELIEISETSTLLEFEYETEADELADSTEVIATTLEFRDGTVVPPVVNQVYVSGVTSEVHGIPASVDLTPSGTVRYIRGDCNADGSTDLADGIFVLEHLFQEAQRLGCLDSCDFDGDQMFDTQDAISLFNWRYLGGAEPPAPFPACGFSDSLELADCESYEPCE